MAAEARFAYPFSKERRARRVVSRRSNPNLREPGGAAFNIGGGREPSRSRGPTRFGPAQSEPALLASLETEKGPDHE